MGRYKFRLSDMIPHAWFHKLKDMSRLHTASKKQQSLGHETTSCKLIIRRSRRRRRSCHSPRTSFSSSSYSFNSSSNYTSSSSSSSTALLLSKLHPSSQPPPPPPPNLIPNRPSYYISTRSPPPPNPAAANKRPEKITEAAPPLPPILTKLSKKEPYCNNIAAIPAKLSSSQFGSPVASKITKNNDNAASPAKFKRPPPPVPPRFNLRATNSPRLASKKVQAAFGSGRRSTSNAPPVPARKTTSAAAAAAGGKKQSRSRVTSESFAVVKSSADPRRDFRESMVEMIVENGICSSKDLEDLLACYLALNSNEYHELIVKVFEQIWLDLADIKLGSCK